DAGETRLRIEQRIAARHLEILARVFLQRERLANLRIGESALVERYVERNADRRLPGVAGETGVRGAARQLRIHAADEIDRGQAAGALALDFQRSDIARILRDP